MTLRTARKNIMSETVNTNGACALSRYITAMTITMASSIESVLRNGPGASRIRGISSAVFDLGAMMKMQLLGVLVIGSLPPGKNCELKVQRRHLRL
jgi:hypothetical protein